MTTTTRKRGRPRRESNVPNTGYSISNELRTDIQHMIQTCPTCGKPAESVAGLAKKMGIAPLTLSSFLKGKTGFSQDTFEKVYAYVWQSKNAVVPVIQAEVSAE